MGIPLVILQDQGWLDTVQLALGAAGMIPGFGEPFDLADAGISYLRGDYIGASLSMAAAIPGIGNVAGASKIFRKASKVTKGLETRGFRAAPGERTIQGQVDAATQGG